MHVVQTCRQGKDKIPSSECILRVATINRVAREGGRIAEIFLAGAAIPANSVGPSDPRDANSCSDRQVRGGAVHHIADDLMSRDHTWFQHGKFSLADVQVSAANPAGANFQKHLICPHYRYGGFSNSKRTLRDRPRLIEMRSEHTGWDKGHGGCLQISTANAKSLLLGQFAVDVLCFYKL